METEITTFICSLHAICIEIFRNVRKGLIKGIAGTYLNLALYFCVFSKYLMSFFQD